MINHLDMFEVLLSIAYASFALLAQMAPYLILGLVAAGVMHVLIPVGSVAKHLGKPGFGSVFRAAILGIPLPICSCGVIPVAAALKKDGASNGAVVSFLVTTPTTGVDSILATFSLLGGFITVARVVASFFIGLVAGLIGEVGRSPQKKAKETEIFPIATSCSTRLAADKGSVLVKGLKYAFHELLAGISKPLLLGSVVGGLLVFFLPEGILEQYVGAGIISYLVMLGLGIPLYVCASGSIPLAAALLLKGISPGAALVFLIAGPATNIATISVVSNMMGRKILFSYLATIILGALALGFATDAVLSFFPSLSVQVAKHTYHEDHGLSFFHIVSGTVLGILMLFHLSVGTVTRLLKKKATTKNGVVFLVPDMNCGHCASTIQKALANLPGVKQVDARPSQKLLRVEIEQGTNTQSIEKAIEDAGFHPTLKAP